mmetsp:Transcript_19659/g.50095  ORF Transcript_19659/g.50095 Transcript_19659/m.50095 type:complete len:210 (-) Transcript_19659:819-1448(-)
MDCCLQGEQKHEDNEPPRAAWCRVPQIVLLLFDHFGVLNCCRRLECWWRERAQLIEGEDELIEPLLHDVGLHIRPAAQLVRCLVRDEMNLHPREQHDMLDLMQRYGDALVPADGGAVVSDTMVLQRVAARVHLQHKEATLPDLLAEAHARIEARLFEQYARHPHWHARAAHADSGHQLAVLVSIPLAACAALLHESQKGARLDIARHRL